MRKTRIKKTVVLYSCAQVASAVLAQSPNPYSLNIVGYYNVSIYAGNNLIGNELDDDAGDFIDNVLGGVPNGGLAVGSTFTEYNSSTKSLFPLSTWNGHTWSINYALPVDETGAVLNSPIKTTITFTGAVDYVDPADISILDYIAPIRDPGTYLLASAEALDAATFQEIIGRDPNNGESVTTLDAATQTYSTTTFDDGSWNNGVPSLPLGEAAYFDIVPEPSTYALAGMAAAILLGSRHLRVRS